MKKKNRKAKEVENQEVSRKYAAAKHSPSTGLFHASNTTVKDEIGTSWSLVTARQSQLIRDMPIFAGAVNAKEAFEIGEGIKPQWNIIIDGKPNKETAQLIEDRFNEWADDPNNCDFGGRLSFWDMQRLAVRQEAEFGEYLFIERYDNGNYQLNSIEPTQLKEEGFGITNASGGQAEWRGIRYDTLSLKALEYVFMVGEDFTKDIRVKSNQVIHGFKVSRSGQLRGITEFASAILSAHMLKDYMQSELTAQNLSSRYLAFVTAPSHGVHTANTNTDITYQDTYSRFTEALDYATIQYLKSDEKVTMNTANRDINGFSSFNKIIIKYICASTGLPYELLSQDYEGLNFTTLRAVRNDFKQLLRPRWQRIKTTLCNRVANNWLKNEVMSGRLKIKGYFKNPKDFHRVRWITPALEQVDPLKEFNAELLKVNAGFRSPQSVMKSMGEDPDKVLEEIANWRDLLKENNLSFMNLASAKVLNNNFTMIGSEDENKEEDDGQE